MAWAGTGTTLNTDNVRGLCSWPWSNTRPRSVGYCSLSRSPVTNNMRRGKLPAINSNFDAGLGFCRCFNVCFLDRAVTINKELLCERFIKTYKLCICVCVCVSSLFPLLCSKIALITYLSLLISMLLLQYKGTLAMPDTDTSILKL